MEEKLGGELGSGEKRGGVPYLLSMLPINRAIWLNGTLWQRKMESLCSRSAQRQLRFY